MSSFQVWVLHHQKSFLWKTNKKPVCIELSSNVHRYYAFDNHIYYFSCMTSYVLLVWQAYFCFLMYANNFWNCWHMYLYKILMPICVKWQPEIFYIYKPYLFLHIYNPLTIPCLAIIFVLCKCLSSFYCNSYFIVAGYIFSFISMTTYVFLVW